MTVLDAELATEVFASPTGAVPAEAWDRLAGSRVYSSSRWLRFCAGDSAADRNAGGSAGSAGVGRCGTAGGVYGGPADAPDFAAPVTRVVSPGHEFYAWADLLAARGLPALPPAGIMVGAGRGYRTHLLPAGGDRVAAAAGVLASVRALAGPAAAVAMYLDDADVAAFRAAGVVAAPVLLALDATLELPPGGWESYLGALSVDGRRGVRRDAQRFAASGLRVVHRPAAECAAQAGRLMAATEARYGHYADPAGLAAAFAAQAAAMGEVAEVAFAVDEAGTPTGFCLYYRWHEVLYARAVGFDYAAARQAGEYFELFFRQPILAAYRHGCRRVHFGIGAPEAKARRGATLRGLWLLDLTPSSPLAGQDAAVAAANRALLAELAGPPAVAAALAPDVAALP